MDVAVLLAAKPSLQRGPKTAADQPCDVGKEADFSLASAWAETSRAGTGKSLLSGEAVEDFAPLNFLSQKQRHQGSFIASRMKAAWTVVGIAAWLVVCLTTLAIFHPPCVSDPSLQTSGRWTNPVTPTRSQYDCCGQQRRQCPSIKWQ